MRCDEAAEFFSRAALGELAPEARQALEDHCRNCPECLQEWSAAQLLVSALQHGSRPAPEAEGQWVAQARQLLAQEAWRQAGRRGRRGAFRMAAAAAALVLLAWGAYLSFRPEPQEVAAPNQAGSGKERPGLGVPSAGASGAKNAPGQDWCFVQGDAGNARRLEGFKEELTAERVQRRWDRSIEGESGAYKPLVWQGQVFVGTHAHGRDPSVGGGIRCFRISDGEELWTRQFETGDFFKARNYPDRCLSEGRLYLTDGQRCLVLDPRDGRTVRSLDPPAGVDGWGYLAASAGVLYGVARDGTALFGVDADSGRGLWVQRTVGLVHLPAYAEGRIFAQTRAGGILALDAGSGSVLWKVEGATPVGRASVHVRGDRMLVASEFGYLLAFGVQDGALRWRHLVPGLFWSGMALSETQVLAQGGSRVFALSDGRPQVVAGGLSTGLCAPPTVLGNGLLTVAGSRAGELSWLSLNDGRRQGSAPAAMDACEGPVAGAGCVITVGGGRLVAAGVN